MKLKTKTTNQKDYPYVPATHGPPLTCFIVFVFCWFSRSFCNFCQNCKNGKTHQERSMSAWSMSTQSHPMDITHVCMFSWFGHPPRNTTWNHGGNTTQPRCDDRISKPVSALPLKFVSNQNPPIHALCILVQQYLYPIIWHSLHKVTSFLAKSGIILYSPLTSEEAVQRKVPLIKDVNEPFRKKDSTISEWIPLSTYFFF